MRKSPIQASGTTVRLAVHSQPGAKVTEVAGIHGDSIKIKVAALPVDGKANVELIHFLSDMLNVPRRAVRILRGETNRDKLIEIQGLTEDEVRAGLGL